MKAVETRAESKYTSVAAPLLKENKKNEFFSTSQEASNLFFSPGTIQPKLKIGQPNDKYEQQADRMADTVMRMSDPQVQRQPMEEKEELQLKQQPDIQRKCKECEKEEKLQKKSDGNAPSANHASSEISSQLTSSAGRGSRLPDDLQSEMSHKIGADFSGVGIHTDSKAAHMNRQLGAKAFTYGDDVYFNKGEYNPGSYSGKHLLAHELTHVIQQRSGVVQMSPDDKQPEAGDNGVWTLIREAEEAIDDGGGRADFHYLFADLEGHSTYVWFDDHRVQKFFRHLFIRWFGAVSVKSLEDSPDFRGVPPWVGEFRARALNVRPQKSGTEGTGQSEEARVADLAVKLADSVSAETPAQKIRRQFVEEIDKRIGTTIMSQEDIDKEREKEASGGYTPKNFTTCIKFFCEVAGQVSSKAGLTSPLLKGPNYYKEINREAEESLGDAWIPCTPSFRPKPGDLLIFTFTSDVMDAEGKKKYGKGWFAHITILRSIEVLKPGSKGPIEKWTTVDGGGTTAVEKVRYFYPDTCLITDRSGKRTVKGWIDVEKAAEAKLVKMP